MHDFVCAYILFLFLIGSTIDKTAKVDISAAPYSNSSNTTTDVLASQLNKTFINITTEVTNITIPDKSFFAQLNTCEYSACVV